MKISTADAGKRQKLELAPIHNLSEECSVGWFNYEIDFRGHKHLESVSRKMVINRNIDLVMKQDPKDIYLYKKQAAAIKDLKLEWNDKVNEQKKLGVSDQEAASLTAESAKFELL